MLFNLGLALLIVVKPATQLVAHGQCPTVTYFYSENGEEVPLDLMPRF